MDTSGFQLSNVFSTETRLLRGNFDLLFKCEDYTEAGVPVGPLYAVTGDHSQIRSRRYVSLDEAKQVARFFGADLEEF